MLDGLVGFSASNSVILTCVTKRIISYWLFDKTLVARFCFSLFQCTKCILFFTAYFSFWFNPGSEIPQGQRWCDFQPDFPHLGLPPNPLNRRLYSIHERKSAICPACRPSCHHLLNPALPSASRKQEHPVCLSFNTQPLSMENGHQLSQTTV